MGAPTEPGTASPSTKAAGWPPSLLRRFPLGPRRPGEADAAVELGRTETKHPKGPGLVGQIRQGLGFHTHLGRHVLWQKSGWESFSNIGHGYNYGYDHICLLCTSRCPNKYTSIFPKWSQEKATDLKLISSKLIFHYLSSSSGHFHLGPSGCDAAADRKLRPQNCRHILGIGRPISWDLALQKLEKTRKETPTNID